MRGLTAIALLAAAGLGYGQTPGCPVAFRTSSVVSLDTSGTTHTVLLRQQDGSYTGYELVVSSPYRLIRTTPNFPNQVGPCPPAAGTPAGLVPGDAMVLSSGQVLLVTVKAPGIDVLLFDRNMNLISETPYDLSPSVALETVLADLNGDGNPDIVVVQQQPKTPAAWVVAALLGTGGTSFGPASQVFTVAATSVRRPVVADVNGDHKPDLLITTYVSGTNTGAISELLGKGDGTFQSATTAVSVSGAIAGMAAADLNADGRTDLAFTYTPLNTNTWSAGVVLGVGKGTFGTLNSFDITDGEGIAIADMNGDGKPDIVTSGVSILFGDATGGFPTRQDYMARFPGTNVIPADLNDDGRMDVVLGSGNASIITSGYEVLYGRRDGTWSGAPASEVPFIGMPDNNVTGLIAADFNGDGIPDLVLSDLTHLDLLLGHGDGTFEAVFPYTPVSGYYTAITAADFNGDGKADIAGAINSEIDFFFGTSDRALEGPDSVNAPSGVVALAAADFNGDKKQDLAALTATQLLIFNGKGDGTFATPVSYDVGPGAAALTIADLNGDGKPDIVVANSGTATAQDGGLTILLGKGDGTFSAPVTLALNGGVGVGPMKIVPADFNGDGKPDLAVGIPAADQSIAILLGRGDGTFNPPLFSSGNVSQLLAGDFNRDGIPDLLAVGTLNNSTILLGNGDGTFAPGPLIPGLMPATVADLNSDGAPDIAIVDPWFGVAAFLNTTSTTVPLTLASAAAGVPPPLAPDSLVTVYGQGLSNGVGSTPSASYPLTLANTSVSVLDAAGITRPAPLLYVSPTQINFQMPAGTSTGDATITFSHGSGFSVQQAQVEIASVAPSLFTFDASGLAASYVIRVTTGGKATVESVYTDNGGVLAPLPIDVTNGSVYLILYGTGLRNAGTGGVTAKVQSLNAAVSYAGAQSQYPGLDQVNVLLPPSLAGSGDVSVILTANGVESNTVHVTIQ